jgi:F-type H+-transporting ATPase subunit b
MLIDLFTVIAQIVNFLILVLLLKKFLFNKIVSIMDEREEKISEQLANAEQQEKDTKKELEKQQKIREKLEQEWDNDFARIKKELQFKREEMMKEARKTVNQNQEDWKNAMLKQRGAFLRELRYLSCQQVCQVSKKVLADLADEKLENQLISSFMNQLEELQEDKKQEFKLSELDEGKEVEIFTAFQLQKKDKDLVTEKIENLAHKDVQIVFKKSNDLICGIELRSEGKKIAWSIESYLDVLEKRLKEIFEEGDPEEDIDSQESNGNSNT